MKVFIPSKGRASAITTHTVFRSCDYFVVVHNDEEYKAYCENDTIPRQRLIVSHVPADTYGLTRQREWICKNLAAPDEWFVFADDNIMRLTRVASPFYQDEELPVQDSADRNWKTVFGYSLLGGEFLGYAGEMAARMSRLNLHWGGFAVVDNPYFRGKHWRTVGYVVGKLTVCHNNGVPFDHTISMEDFNNTGEQLLRYGGVLINNFIYPIATHYQSGGMGRYEERVPVRLLDVQKLLAKFPGLFRVKDRPGFIKNTDLALRLVTPQQVYSWRCQMMRKRGVENGA